MNGLIFLSPLTLVMETPFAIHTAIGQQAQPLQEIIDRAGAVGPVRFLTATVRAKRLGRFLALVLSSSALPILRRCGPRRHLSRPSDHVVHDQ